MRNRRLIESTFKAYVAKLLGNNGTTVITQQEAVECLSLALSKCELIEREYDLMVPQSEKSKNDISGTTKFKKMVDALQLISQCGQGDVVDASFDEPAAAKIARNTLITVSIPKDEK